MDVVGSSPSLPTLLDYSRHIFVDAAKMSSSPQTLCTPKGSHITAQGRDEGAHPGKRGPENTTMKGLYTRMTRVEPLQGSCRVSNFTQGAEPAVATLGCEVSPLQGPEVASTVSGFWLTTDG